MPHVAVAVRGESEPLGRELPAALNETFERVRAICLRIQRAVLTFTDYVKSQEHI